MLPGTESAPDDLDSLVQQLGTENEPGTGSDSSGLPPPLQPSGHGEPKGTAGQQQATPQDLEKRYKGLRAGYEKTSQKLKTWEGLLRNPKLLELARTDPEVREALAKAGYQQALEQQAQEEQGDAEEEIDPVRLVYDLRAEMEIDREFSSLEREIKREVTPQERKEIMAGIERWGGFTVKQAWKLTPSYEKHLKDSEDKRVNDAVGKARPYRPRPPSPLLPGAKAPDLKKPVTEMNEAERRAYLTDLIEKNA